MSTRKSSLVAAAALLCAVCGCNQSPLVSATGRVTYKGDAVPSTRVTFYPDDGNRRSTAITDDDGKFTLKFSRTQDGVYRGRHTVGLRYEPSAEEELHKIQPKASRQLQEVIARYSDPKKSGLQYEVTENGQHFEIELK
jgi:hypothetical protein